MTQKKGFGLFLEKARKELGLTQKVLSFRMLQEIPELGLGAKKEKHGAKTAPAGYGYYEKFEFAPKLEVVIRLAVAFELPVDYLLHYEQYKDINARDIVGLPLGLDDNFAAFSFGALLRKARNLRGLSMQQFADKANLSKATIQEYEKDRLPTADVDIKLFSQLLEVPEDYFLPSIKPLAELIKIQHHEEKYQGVAGISGSFQFTDNADIYFRYEERDLDDGTTVVSITLPHGEARKAAIEKAIVRLRSL